MIWRAINYSMERKRRRDERIKKVRYRHGIVLPPRWILWCIMEEFGVGEEEALEYWRRNKEQYPPELQTRSGRR